MIPDHPQQRARYHRQTHHPKRYRAEVLGCIRSVDYDTNKRGASLLLSCEWSAPPYVSRQLPARSTKRYPRSAARRQKSTSSNQSGKNASSNPPNSCHTARRTIRNAPAGCSTGIRRGVIQIQSPIPPVHRVIRPDPVEQESFQNQGGGRGKLADHETDLRMAIRVHQQTAGARGSGQVAGVAQRLQAGLPERHRDSAAGRRRAAIAAKP